MEITKEMFVESFADDVTLELTAKTREIGDRSFIPVDSIVDNNQITKPTNQIELSKVVKEVDGSFLDENGNVYAYEFPQVKQTVRIRLDTTLGKFSGEAGKSLVILAQKTFRKNGTKWMKDNPVVELIYSELSKGRVKMTNPEKVDRLSDGMTAAEIDETMAMLREKRKAAK